jgi:GntR family transcriptional regulator, transcriptional repressor for pyruvate dehydrogenase complex
VPSLQLKAPRVAEMVATHLRREILSGQLSDGATLPNQDVLAWRFGVSKASLREAFRILESERLITVRRGKFGGVVVHAPTTPGAAYALGLILHAKGVPASDLATAIECIESVCAMLCAGRTDRLEAVVPELERLLQELAEYKEQEAEEYAQLETRFHTAIVQGCGNVTMTSLGYVVEDLMEVQRRYWLDRAMELGLRPNLELREYDYEAFEAIVDAIRSGSTETAASRVRDYFRGRTVHHSAVFKLVLAEPIQFSVGETRIPPTLVGPSDLLKTKVGSGSSGK